MRGREPRFSASVRAALLIVGLGALVRLVLLATTPGVERDLHALDVMGAAVAADPLSAYSMNLLPGTAVIWPYPGGLLPVLGILHEISEALGISLRARCG